MSPIDQELNALWDPKHNRVSFENCTFEKTEKILRFVLHDTIESQVALYGTAVNCNWTTGTVVFLALLKTHLHHLLRLIKVSLPQRVFNILPVRRSVDLCISLPCGVEEPSKVQECCASEKPKLGVNEEPSKEPDSRVFGL
ncbi:hypothetical protein TKK_0012279 [Trichogramma kaykai]